jgi:hypothetical protein
MRVRRIWGVAVAVLAAASVAVAATDGGYSGSIGYHRTNAGKTKGTATTGIRGKGVFSGKLATGSRSLIAGYAAAAGIPLSDVVKGGRYAVMWSMDKGKIHGTALAKFKSAAAGTVCVTYVASATQFDANFHVTPPHGTFATVGGTGKGARSALNGTFAVGKAKYQGDADLTDSVTGKMNTKSSAARPLSATCKTLAKAAG